MNASAIAHHHQVLKRLLAVLLVYAGLTDENEQVRSPAGMRQRASEPFTLARRFCDLVLRLLVPLESAARRLILVVASTLPADARYLAKKAPLDTSNNDAHTDHLVSSLPCGEGPAVGVSSGADPGPSASALMNAVAPPLPLFALADRLKRYDWYFNPRPEGATPWQGPGTDRADPNERLNALPLMRRVAALELALDDLEGQARRFLRWRAMRLKARAAGRFVSISPMRVGFAPGSLPPSAPKRLEREEHYTLRELHFMALEREQRLDSS